MVNRMTTAPLQRQVKRNYSELGSYADQEGSAVPVTRAPLTYRVIRMFILRTFCPKYHSH